MELLDAALALSLTLAALAGVTTLIMELGHRILGLKAAQFRRMVQNLAAAEIVPLAVRKFLEERAARPGGMPTGITTVMTATLGAAKAPGDLADDELRTLLPALVQQGFREAEDQVQDAIAKLLANSSVPAQVRTGILRRTEEMDTDEVVKRLGQLELFKDIKKAGTAAAERAVARIEETYEEIAQVARDYFTRRAKLFALFVGVALAFAVNADGYRIFRLYLQEPTTAQALIRNRDEILKTVQARNAELDAALEALKTRAGADAGSEAARKEVQAVEARLKEVGTQLASLSSQGLPIGYDNWVPPPEGGSRAARYWHVVAWFLSVLITGLLIGLGGPFWYDIAMKLNQARHIIRGSGSALPATPRQARQAMPDATGSVFADRTILARTPVPSAAEGRTANPRNVAAFKGTQPVSAALTEPKRDDGET